MQFTIDFDDMEPFKLMNNPQDASSPDLFYVMISTFHYIVVPYIMMILAFDDVANKIIREFVDEFKNEMKKKVEKKRSSKTNRYCCRDRRPISLPCRWILNIKLVALSTFKIVRRVLYLNIVTRDFNATRFLISLLSAEHFLKYMLFHICPSIREKRSVSHSLSPIQSFSKFDDTMVLQQVIILIYNELTEMRLVADLDDLDSYLLEQRKITLTEYSNPGSPLYYLNTFDETENIWVTLVDQYKSAVPKLEFPDVTAQRGEL
ncbi:hypothetical protein RF11_04014 [Thelohanellus kitauei]|uniref:Uncharacterized protein n=1 Tax=Thelohanellus kitauei TaxID=669202 RepID=A0A0C2MPT4_THEKT|nr:hypothetical protein RF11_04014 [Thelohanellus kitauei]